MLASAVFHSYFLLQSTSKPLETITNKANVENSAPTTRSRSQKSK